MMVFLSRFLHHHTKAINSQTVVRLFVLGLDYRSPEAFFFGIFLVSVYFSFKCLLFSCIIPQLVFIINDICDVFSSQEQEISSTRKT